MERILFKYLSINNNKPISLTMIRKTNDLQSRTAYRAPETEIAELQQSGVLCQSGSMKDFDHDQFPW